jgi:hypothetical protein
LKTFFIKEICKKLHKQRISVHEVVVFSGAVFVILAVLQCKHIGARAMVELSIIWRINNAP